MKSHPFTTHHLRAFARLVATLLAAAALWGAAASATTYVDAIGINLGTSVTDGFGYGGQEGQGGGPGPGITGFVSPTYLGGSALRTQDNWNNFDIATNAFTAATVTDNAVAVPGLTFAASGGAFFETPGHPTVGRELDWTVWCNNGGNQTFTVTGIPFETWDLVVLDYNQYNWDVWTTVLTGQTGSSATFGGGYQQAMGAMQILKHAPTTAYWTGAANPIDSLWTSPANFSSDLAGVAPTIGALPTTTDVVFTATAAANFVNTTLGADQSIKTLTITSPAAIGIGGIDTLTITPGAPTAGITVAAGAPGAVTHTISSSLALGAAQTWTVADADRTLVVGGNVSGNFPLTKAGDGVLDLNSPQAYDTFTAAAGTTNVNGAFAPPVGTTSVTVSPGAKLKFGSVSQTLGALSIGAGATVSFTSGAATGSFAERGKLAGGAAGIVPEPGAASLLLLGALGLLHRRTRCG